MSRRIDIHYNDLQFSAPTPLSAAELPTLPGVYAVAVRNPVWRPAPFQPIYFGQAGNLSQVDLGPGHEAFARWHRHPLASDGLFASFYVLLYSSETMRRATEMRLIAEYRPDCNHPVTEIKHGLLGLARGY